MYYSLREMVKYVEFDYEPLTLSDVELEILHKLYVFSNETGYEYGLWYSEATGFSDFFTSKNANRIDIPEAAYNEKGICLYHSHTNATHFSDKDYSWLLRDNVKRIVVITSEKFVLSAEINDGVIPSFDEYQAFVLPLKSEIDFYMIEMPDFDAWSEEQRFLESSYEEAFRIARNFKWRLEGGTL